MPKRSPAPHRKTGPVVFTVNPEPQVCNGCQLEREVITVADAKTKEVLVHLCGFELAQGMESLTGYKYVKYFATMAAQQALRKHPKRRYMEVTREGF